MEKDLFEKNKELYGLNTSMKYIKTDARNKDYIYIQHKHENYIHINNLLNQSYY